VKSDPGIQKAIADRERYRPFAEVEKQYAVQLDKWKKEVAAAAPQERRMTSCPGSRGKPALPARPRTARRFL